MVVVVIEVSDLIGVLMTPFIYIFCIVEQTRTNSKRLQLHSGLGQLMFYVLSALFDHVLEHTHIPVLGILMAPDVVSTQF